ncbi:MAG: ketopantoate reductase family protein [Alphaproteobacteria bacterium]|nr:ketopantoate reductase family protein [Alphaproteobacteria bacterium]
MSEPIVIWGAGAVGGTIGAYWARAGHDVLFVDNVSDHVAAMNDTGLAIEGPIEQFTVAAKAAEPGHLKGRFRRIVLGVKAHHTEAATHMLAPHLAEDGFVLSAQNGLNEPVIARVVGERRTMGCFVNFGADWLGPGRILFGGRGAVVVGEIDGTVTPRARDMHELLQVFEPNAVLTDNIWGFLWGKLGYGSLLFATALTNESIRDCLASSRHYPIFRRVGEEVNAVADAKRIKCLGFNGYDPAAFRRDASEAATRASLQAMSDHNKKSAKSHSGIWRDLAVRKRKTEVDAQVGVVVAEAKALGIATPTLAKLAQLIHDIEDGKRPLSLDTLDLLAA